jgi:cytochrome P450
MQEIMLEIILRLVFGIRDTYRLARLRALLPRLVDIDAATAVVLLLPPRLRAWTERSRLLRRMSFLPSSRFFGARDEVDRILYEEIEHRRTAADAGGTDVLSRLLAARDDTGRPMSDQELRDELITLLEAGHETTATGLAWTFERLLRHPAALARLLDELDAGQDETYINAVIKESLRARPVVYDAPRLLDAPLKLGGYDIPADWFAAPLISLIHRDPEAYPQPEEFRPERFLGQGGDDTSRANGSWMPFGGGRRYCVGAQLALLEMRVVIREVLQRLELHAPDPAPEAQKMKHVTFVPARQTRVIARARSTIRTAAG